MSVEEWEWGGGGCSRARGISEGMWELCRFKRPRAFLTYFAMSPCDLLSLKPESRMRSWDLGGDAWKKKKRDGDG